ncbi:hypothetical protein AB0B45_44520 [Nonomuraea sp. NPDC049152]|uniref:hypothetical protein n=1 Tax=Nonomuraea sp. NPDC049152 TaxID=3154350 RepID=UPI003411AAB1
MTCEHLNRIPSPGAHGAHRGFGLYLIRRLCDEVRLDRPDGHSRLRLHMRYPAAPVARRRME